jgi:hypothetical protein
MNNKNKIHVGQQILNRDFIKQPHMRKQIQNSLENKLQEIGLGETRFVQNGLRISNSSNLNKVKAFSIKPNSIQ